MDKRKMCMFCLYFWAGGYCHRYPPVGTKKIKQGKSAKFPRVAGTDLCGEFDWRNCHVREHGKGEPKEA